MKGAIHLAFCWSMDDTDLAAALTRLKSYGFEGVELWTSAIEKHGAAAWATALRDTEMQCAQICPYFDIVNGHDAITRTFEILEENLALCKILDCTKLRVFTGPVHSERSVSSTNATPAQWQAAADTLQKMCDRAAQAAVELCLECHEGMLTESSASALRLINAVERPNLTANLQIPLAGDSWETSIAALGSYTTHIHIHNWHSDSMDFGGGLTFLDAGWFQWQPIVSALVNDYSRTLCLSVEHPAHGGKDDPWVTAKRDGAYLTNLRAGIEANVR